MDLLILAAISLGTFIVGIAGNVIASELYDLSPSLAHRLIEIAVTRLPEHDRARFREEWHAHLDDCPSKLGKLWHAMGCLFGARAVAHGLANPNAVRAGMVRGAALKKVIVLGMRTQLTLTIEAIDTIYRSRTKANIVILLIAIIMGAIAAFLARSFIAAH